MTIGSTKSSGDVSPDLARLRQRLNQIEYLPIGNINSYKRKLRKRSDKGRRSLINSVSAFGIVLPILINKDGVIIAGEGVFEAARSVGYKEVPTLRVEHLSEQEEQLLRIGLNKIAEHSEWDKIELKTELTEIVGFDLDINFEVMGFETQEVDNIVYAYTPSDEDPDDEQMPVGEPGSATARLGDLWMLGDHLVVCGSSLDQQVLSRLMNGERARMVLSDAPYNKKVSSISSLGKTKHREFPQASGEMSESQFIDFLTTSTQALAAFSEEGALLYLFMDWPHQWEMLSAIRANGLTMMNLAVWVKRSPGMGSFLRSQHELVFIAKKGTAPHRQNVQLGRFGRNRSNCWMYSGVNSFSSGRDDILQTHPTSKNVSMLSDAIRDATHKGEIVLDGFLGSGSTLIGAERTGRVCRGVELDPLYVDVIIRRWEKATGREAVLHGADETFAQVAERRAREVASEAVAPKYVARVRTRSAA